jgi:hypothetical protein
MEKNTSLLVMAIASKGKTLMVSTGPNLRRNPSVLSRMCLPLRSSRDRNVTIKDVSIGGVPPLEREANVEEAPNGLHPLSPELITKGPDLAKYPVVQQDQVLVAGRLAKL